MTLGLRMHGLSGQLCNVEAERGWTVRRVKDAVEAAAGVPWWEQRLVFGSSELLDDERLGASLRNAGADTSAEALDMSVFRANPDREEWLALVQERPAVLHEAPPPILADGEILLAAVRNDSWVLAYAAKELRSDVAWAMAAVELNGLALRHLCAGPRADRQVVLAAVGQNGQALKDAGEAFQADREVVLTAMRRSVDSLVHASPALLGDKGFVLEALRLDWRVLRYAPQEVQKDPDVVHAAAGLGMAASLLLAELLGEASTEDEERWVEASEAAELGERGCALFLDARFPEEFAVSHLPGAHNMPGGTLEQLVLLERTPAFGLLVEREDLQIVVYSDNGGWMSRCVNITQALRSNARVDSGRVLRLAGGLNAWKRAGLPVEGDAREMFSGHALGDHAPAD